MRRLLLLLAFLIALSPFTVARPDPTGPVGPAVEEADAGSFFDATMSTSAGNVSICGFRSTYGYVKISYYNGAWGWLGSASDGDGVVCATRWCPSSATNAYWVVVSAPGYSSYQELFYRNYRC